MKDFLIIFLIAFVLYQLPVKAVCYPAILCLCLGIVFVILDFLRVKQKHELLEGIQGLTDLTLEALPAVDGMEDED